LPADRALPLPGVLDDEEDQGMRIAIVDDDPLVRMGLRAILASVDGWGVVAEAGDGRKAIDVVRESSPISS
jgi:chemotaxis response regulator CheB